MNIEIPHHEEGNFFYFTIQSIVSICWYAQLCNFWKTVILHNYVHLCYGQNIAPLFLAHVYTLREMGSTSLLGWKQNEEQNGKQETNRIYGLWRDTQLNQSFRWKKYSLAIIIMHPCFLVIIMHHCFLVIIMQYYFFIIIIPHPCFLIIIMHSYFLIIIIKRSCFLIITIIMMHSNETPWEKKG